MDGQVYVTVQADASNSKARSVGSDGSTTLQFTINWSFDRGISGQYGWDTPKKVNYVEGDVEATNAAVNAAYQQATIDDLFAIKSCVNFS